MSAPSIPISAGRETGLWISDMDARQIGCELRRHAPFTALGTLTGIALMLVIVLASVPASVSRAAFWTLHPMHVLLSAMVTTAMYRRHGGRGWWRLLLVGYLGSVGIATVSDSLIPFAGELLVDLPNRGLHLGFVEKWWLVNPLAILGIVIGFAWPHTRVSHAAHVLLSTWASLFHITMAMGTQFTWAVLPLIALLLFLAVWVPCCTSDIVFPLLFVRRQQAGSPVQERLGPSFRRRTVPDSASVIVTSTPLPPGGPTT